MTAAAAEPAKAPVGCFWRGNVLWGQVKVGGRRYAWTLRTSDPAIAAERRTARAAALRDPVGAEDAKERLRAGRKLTAPQLAFVESAIDHLLAGRLGPRGEK